MDNLIDFSNCEQLNFLSYNGGNGSKIGINYNGTAYMLKFPPYNDKTNIYTNSCISEYISCHIFQMLGFETQNTMLGIYNQNGEEKIVVACKDFTMDKLQKEKELHDFASIKNTIIENSLSNGYGTELNDVIETILNQNILPENEMLEHFWNMFIVDSLLGNFDRHNGNWGFLVDLKTHEISFAPIYDCGSCLYPQLSDEQMKEYLNNEDEINKRIYVFPNSALKINDRKINYYDFINSLQNEDCNNALLRIYTRINLNEIKEFIDNVPLISDTRKTFYKTMIESRLEKILEPAFTKIEQLEQNNNTESDDEEEM